MIPARAILCRPLQRHLHSQAASVNPWFVYPKVTTRFGEAPATNTNIQPNNEVHSLPKDVPSYIQELYSVLQTSPFLEPSQLMISRPLELGEGPGLPRQKPRGVRRSRRQTFAGQGIAQTWNLWEWAVYAQVKEGTEKRGAIEAVVKTVRATLRSIDPTLPIPANRRQSYEEGWAMLDVGNVAIHVLSRAARDKFFGSEQW